MSYKDILKQYWGYTYFRGIQKDIIESIGAGKDTLGLMPTGGGKSITFQVPALSMEGICLVVTPLIALMRDQVEHLRKRGIPAAAIYTGLSHEEIVTILDNCVFGGVKFLYISPERIGSELFQAKLKFMKICFITVDEAHCISQWGYDFRPSYLKIATIRQLLPAAPILALTATATPDVVDDIQRQLGFARQNVFRMSFERTNLAYVVREAEDKNSEMIHILQSIPYTAIVYCRSRRRVKEIAELLIKEGISATWYHAGLEPATKDERQTDWQNNKVRVMVATNAFGMGIDKDNVRVVIHVDCPSSIEAYFQEAGRAGRDGKKAYAVLLYNKRDKVTLQNRIEETFPPKDYIKTVYEHLAYFFQIGVGSAAGHTFEFPIDKFCYNFKHFPVRTNSALNLLDRAGYISYDANPDNSARVHFLLRRDELYLLEGLSPTENKILISLLRLYGNLFSDYGFIDESYLAQIAGLDINEVYKNLVQLSKRRIIDFIPRKKIPLITYLVNRVDGEELYISKEIYEQRKEEFSKRISAIIGYVENNHVCRSRQLLAYFGEKDTHDCNQCDVCKSATYKEDKGHSKEIKRLILELLSDKKKHNLLEIKKIDNNYILSTHVLEELLSEEIVIAEGNSIYLAW